MAIVSGNHKRHVILVGGLTCGLLFSEYVPPLAQSLELLGWSLVHPLLSSSHQGWGVSSVSTDAEELVMLSTVLKESFDSEEIIVAGHSTGCQDAVMYAKKSCGESKCPALKGVVLQGPASDRDFLTKLPLTEGRIDLCKEMVKAGRKSDVAFRMMEIDGTPMTAERWLSLTTKDGEDDMFSFDLSDAELSERLHSLHDIPTLVLMSGSDEYQVPYGIAPQVMGARIAQAAGSKARLAVIEGGSHDLGEHPVEACKEIITFIKSL